MNDNIRGVDQPYHTLSVLFCSSIIGANAFWARPPVLSIRSVQPLQIERLSLAWTFKISFPSYCICKGRRWFLHIRAEDTAMYEDSWYSFVPDVHGKQDDGHPQKSQHRRRESLLKQPTVRVPPGGQKPIANMRNRMVQVPRWAIQIP